MLNNFMNIWIGFIFSDWLENLEMDNFQISQSKSNSGFIGSNKTTIALGYQDVVNFEIL